MRWRVWITSYPGSYSDVDAKSVESAMASGAREQRASWGSTVEINARELTRGLSNAEHPSGPTFSRLVRINPQGGIER